MAGVSIKYTASDGRSYPDAASMLKSSVGTIIDKSFAEAERAARATVCPVHRQSPKVHRTGTGDKISFHVEACCEAAKDKAEAAIGGAFR